MGQLGESVDSIPLLVTGLCREAVPGAGGGVRMGEGPVSRVSSPLV